MQNSLCSLLSLTLRGLFWFGHMLRYPHDELIWKTSNPPLGWHKQRKWSAGDTAHDSQSRYGAHFWPSSLWCLLLEQLQRIAESAAGRCAWTTPWCLQLKRSQLNSFSVALLNFSVYFPFRQISSYLVKSVDIFHCYSISCQNYRQLHGQ